MSDLCKLETIDDKGFGLVATKDVKRGTLVLKEKAQIMDNGSNLDDPEWSKSVMNSFCQMSEATQKEYLSLHNCLLTKDEIQLRPQVLKMFTTPQEIVKCLSILGIFITNAWKTPGLYNAVPQVPT